MCVAVCLGGDAVENYVVPCVSVCPWGSCGVEMWDVVTWACGGVVGSGAEPVRIVSIEAVSEGKAEDA